MLGLGAAYDIIPAIQPLDLQTARTGDYVSLKNARHVDIVIYKGVGTDGDDPVITVTQAQDVAGTAVKNLAVVTQYWEKEAATDLTGTGTWTRVTQTASQDVAPGDPSAQYAAMYVIPIDADQLDVDNGFDCIKVAVADTGTNAQLGCAFYILSGLRFPDRPQSLPSSIAD